MPRSLPPAKRRPLKPRLRTQAPRRRSRLCLKLARMLVSCAAYQDGTKLGDITVAQIPEYLARPKCFVWVALHNPAPAELAELQKPFDLHPLAVEDALVGHQRPKIEEYGDSLFAVLHLVEPA